MTIKNFITSDTGNIYTGGTGIIYTTNGSITANGTNGTISANISITAPTTNAGNLSFTSLTSNGLAGPGVASTLNTGRWLTITITGANAGTYKIPLCS
jgi:hypothetical protein